MSTDTSIAAVRDELYSRFNIDTGLELLGGLLTTAVTLWVGVSLGIYGFFLFAEELGSSATSQPVAVAFLLGGLLASVSLPVVLAGIASWHDRLAIRDIPFGVLATTAVISAVAVTYLLFAGTSELWSDPLPVVAVKLPAMFVLVWAVCTPGVVATGLLYRHLTTGVSRRHVAGIAVAVLLLVAAGAGSTYGLKTLNDDERQTPIETDGGDVHEQPERKFVLDDDWYHENSSVGAYHDYYTIPDVNEDPYVEEGETLPASKALPCSEQPDAETFTGLNDTDYGVNRTVVDPSRFSLQTWYHTRDDQRIMSHYELDVESSFDGRRLWSDAIANESTQEPSEAYISLGGRIVMINASSVTIYQDVATEDGEVVRYGAKLCRTALE